MKLGKALMVAVASAAFASCVWAARPIVGGGSGFTAFLVGAGAVSTVGLNDFGQLGDGTVSTSPNYRAALAEVASIGDIVQVAGGGAHGVALKRDGTVYTWGRNQSGQLGLGASDTTDRQQPTKVTFFDGLAANNEVIAVAAGTSFTVALTRLGDVYTWGDNTSGQLGNGDNTQQNLPVLATTSIAQISAGGGHVLALRYNGTVAAWGKGTDGQLGDAANSDRNAPVSVAGGLTSVVKVAAGGLHSLALKSDGTAWAWGANANGQLATGNLSPANQPGAVLDQALPGVVALTGIADVAAGASHSLATSAGGVVYSWGKAANGQLGNGDISTDKTAADAIPGLSGVTGIFAWSTADVSFAHLSNGTYQGAFVGFGDNATAQLGVGSNSPGAQPTPQSPALGIVGAKSGQRTNFKKHGASRSDVFWRQDTGVTATWDYTNFGATNFTAAFPAGVPTTWVPKATADVNGDGISDVIWFRPSDGQVAIWLMGSPSVIQAATFPAAVGPGSPWAIQAAGDLDGDGRADIVWRNGATGEMLVWYMRAEGVIDQPVSYGNVTLGYSVVGLADVNGDWRQDIVWFNASSGTVAVWQMSATGAYAAYFPGSVGASPWRIYRLGDFDGDGRDDIFWRNTTDGTTVVWYLRGGNVAQADFLFSAPLAKWTSEGVGDFDGDARDDLLWLDDTGIVVRWLMQGRGVAPIPQSVIGVGPGWSAVQ